MSIEGKVAIVTGAAKGIGRGIAERLASEGAGIAVVDIINASETIKSITSAGGKAQAFIADVSKEDEVTSVVADIEKKLGPCEIMINNAGLHPNPPTLIEDMTFEAWNKMMRVDLDSMFLFNRAVIPGMKKKQWGRIINFSSAVVDAIVPPGAAHYIAAKAGAVGLTRGLATELGDDNITVNSVAPGTVDTPGVETDDPENPKAVLMAATEAQTIKKVTKPSDIAAAVSYLTSEEAELVTGQVIHVDGGSTRT